MSRDIGLAAEALAADYLEQRGYQIVDCNWRNRWCELDIVARKAEVVYFIEVKYRRRTAYGHATDFITYDKRSRLQRAALAWIQAHSYQGPYQIDVIAIEGELDRPSIEHYANAVAD